MCDILGWTFKMLVVNDCILGAIVYIVAMIVPNPVPNTTILALAD